MVWNLAAQLTWPSAKIKINGNGFGPGSGQESVQKTLASPASTACGPDWPNRPSPKEILLYKCKNRSRFFYFSWRPACTLSDAQKQPRLEGKTVHVFFILAESRPALAMAQRGPNRKPFPFFYFLFCRPAGDPPPLPPLPLPPALKSGLTDF